MLVGLAAGVLLGIVGAIVVPTVGGLTFGMNPLAMIVAICLSGAAFGGFVGSLSTS